MPLQHDKNTCPKSKAGSLLNVEPGTTPAASVGRKTWKPVSSLFSIILELLATAIVRARSQYTERKGDVKLSLPADGMIVYVEYS